MAEPIHDDNRKTATRESRMRGYPDGEVKFTLSAHKERRPREESTIDAVNATQPTSDREQQFVYVARLIGPEGVRQKLEFLASDDETAWQEANDGIDSVLGLWVEIKRKPDPQQKLALE
jgi:hypothetical protein